MADMPPAQLTDGELIPGVASWTAKRKEAGSVTGRPSLEDLGAHHVVVDRNHLGRAQGADKGVDT